MAYDFADIEFRPCKCVLTSDNTEELVSLENHWKKRLAGMADVFRSEDYFLEVVPPTVDKGNTLALLIEELKLSTEEVVAIGDGVNDIPMIKYCKYSIGIAPLDTSLTTWHYDDIFNALDFINKTLC